MVMSHLLKPGVGLHSSMGHLGVGAFGSGTAAPSERDATAARRRMVKVVFILDGGFEVVAVGSVVGMLVNDDELLMSVCRGRGGRFGEVL